ncbi:MAG: branched-chain amino acid ABC transporter permease [Burkholderiales bacterium]|nr:branched-chain amino acid ABC transporter permease [Burkholderiales bacterium]
MAQVIVNGIVSAALIAPPAVAFSMLFGILRFPNFAIGGYITVGVFAAYAMNVPLALPFWVAALGATLAGAVIVWISDQIIFRPMRTSAPVTLLVVSIALTFVLEHSVRLIFGPDVKGFNLPLERPITLGQIHITRSQIHLIGTALFIIVFTHLLLTRTRTGRAMRAMADNPELAEVRGIRSTLIRVVATLYCGALLGLSGVSAGFDLAIEPLLGWSLTIPIIAAAILGGIGSVYGAMLGAVLVGLAEEFSTLILPSSYKIAVGFGIIAMLLLLRPQGLLGQPEIKK